MTLLKLKPDLKTYLSFCLIKLLLAPCHDCLTHSTQPETSSGVATLIRGGPHPHKSPTNRPPPTDGLQLHKNAEKRPQQPEKGRFLSQQRDNSALLVHCRRSVSGHNGVGELEHTHAHTCSLFTSALALFLFVWRSRSIYSISSSYFAIRIRTVQC